MNSEEIFTEIKKLRVKMGELWEAKGKTDPEIIGLSVEIDRLINQYYRLKLGSNN